MIVTDTETAAVGAVPTSASGGLGSDCEIIRAHHDRTLAEHGPDHIRAVGWGSIASQEVRFAVLTKVGQLDGASVVDIGCGVGGFFGYLARRAIVPRAYLGLDLNPNMIAAARAKYPEATFVVRDVLAEPLDAEAYDYVVGSGLFGLESPHWHELVCGMLAAMFRACRKAVAVNFLSAVSGNTDSLSHYAEPMEIFAHAVRNLTPRLTLRHDYRTNDFTLYLYK